MSLGQWTFLDYLFVGIILISTIFALRKGLVRELISLAALIGGFLLAAFYYPSIAGLFRDITRTKEVANLIGFLAIFLSTLVVGAIAAFLVNRFVKMAALQWIDRLLGAVFGFLRGWAIASIIALALIAFPVREGTLAQSVLAPYLLAGARAAVLLVPQELKKQFDEQYQKILKNVESGQEFLMSQAATKLPLRFKERLEAICIEMIDKGIFFNEAVEQFENCFIAEIVQRHNGHLMHAAELLGIHRNTLAKKLVRCKARNTRK